MNARIDRLAPRAVALVAVLLTGAAAIFLARVVDHQDEAQWAQATQLSQSAQGSTVHAAAGPHSSRRRTYR